MDGGLLTILAGRHIRRISQPCQLGKTYAFDHVLTSSSVKAEGARRTAAARFRPCHWTESDGTIRFDTVEFIE